MWCASSKAPKVGALGEGNKDRLLLFTDHLIVLLRRYHKTYRPQTWLFYGADRQKPLAITSAQRAYAKAKSAVNIKRPVASMQL